MAKVFEKHETAFCIFLIVVYLLVNSVCVQQFGETSWVGFAANTVLSVCLTVLMVALKRTDYYGLQKVKDPKRYLYFLPLAIMATVNLWNGIDKSHSRTEILFHVLTMINIGFIEEILFRGFLFKMMAKNHVKSAILVSAITFGAGHIMNLLSGAQWIPTLLQICYATATGYLFVIIFHKSGSLIPCILTHCAVNALSVFYVETSVSQYIIPVFLTVFPLAYAVYLNRKIV